MSPEKTEILIKSFPALYEKDFYFECMDGWFDLIFNISSVCEPFAVLTAHMKEGRPTHAFAAQQVKEKFGGLRFYTNACPEEYHDIIYGLIHEAEGRSYEICENCGRSTKDAGEVEEGVNDFFGTPKSKLVHYPKVGLRGFCGDCRKKWK